MNNKVIQYIIQHPTMMMSDITDKFSMTIDDVVQECNLKGLKPECMKLVKSSQITLINAILLSKQSYKIQSRLKAYAQFMPCHELLVYYKYERKLK